MKAFFWRVCGRVYQVRAGALRARAAAFEARAEKFFARVKDRAMKNSRGSA